MMLIAVDMDGTLLTPALTISPGDAQALRDAQRAGCQTVVLTGRCGADAQAFLREAGLNLPVIALNGAQGGNLMADTVFPTEIARRLALLLAKAGVEYMFFGRDTAACNRDEGTGAHWITHHQAVAVYTGDEAVEALLQSGAYKAAYIERSDPQRLKRLRQEAAALPIIVTDSGANNLEFLPLGIDKGMTLKRLSAHLGIPQEQVLAIGDSANDLSMIKWAGCGAAMGNASASVKAAADIVVASNGQKGVAEAIRRFLTEKSL